MVRKERLSVCFESEDIGWLREQVRNGSFASIAEACAAGVKALKRAQAKNPGRFERIQIKKQLKMKI
jgi:Arc/MetJ-type ribon-helix-helix transcriptional regulator